MYNKIKTARNQDGFAVNIYDHSTQADFELSVSDVNDQTVSIGAGDEGGYIIYTSVAVRYRIGVGVDADSSSFILDGNGYHTALIKAGERVSVIAANSGETGSFQLFKINQV